MYLNEYKQNDTAFRAKVAFEAAKGEKTIAWIQISHFPFFQSKKAKLYFIFRDSTSQNVMEGLTDVFQLLVFQRGINRKRNAAFPYPFRIRKIFRF